MVEIESESEVELVGFFSVVRFKGDGVLSGRWGENFCVLEVFKG